MTADFGQIGEKKQKAKNVMNPTLDRFKSAKYETEFKPVDCW